MMIELSREAEELLELIKTWISGGADILALESLEDTEMEPFPETIWESGVSIVSLQQHDATILRFDQGQITRQICQIQFWCRCARVERFAWPAENKQRVQFEQKIGRSKHLAQG